MENKENLKGIGGWLLAYLIIMILSAIYQFFSIITSIIFFRDEYLSSLFAANIWTLLLSIITFLMTLAIIILVYRQKKNAPKWIITIIWAEFVVDLIRTLVVAIPIITEAISGLGAELNLSTGQIIYVALVSGGIGTIFSIAINIILTLYFLKSKRVKNTFVK